MFFCKFLFYIYKTSFFLLFKINQKIIILTYFTYLIKPKIKDNPS